MDEQSKAALELLVQNGYIEAVKGKYRCTAKLNNVIAPMGIVNYPLENVTENWESLYVKFIMDAQVPKRGESTDGTLYDMNKYGAEAMKRFKQMLTKDGIKYDLLVKVTQAYYKGPGRYKKNISNFITEGIWRMDYEMLKGQTTEQQQQTLNKQIDESKPFTRDRIG